MNTKSIVRHNYKNLDIWLLGIKVAREVYQLVKSFPKSEKYTLTNQICRSAVSIPSNIAEGSSRSQKSFSHYLTIALGSAFELETQLIISRNNEYISMDQFDQIQGLVSRLQKMIYRFKLKQLSSPTS